MDIVSHGTGASSPGFKTMTSTKKICDPNQRNSFQRQMTIPYCCEIIFQLNQFPGCVELTGLC